MGNSAAAWIKAGSTCIMLLPLNNPHQVFKWRTSATWSLRIWNNDSDDTECPKACNYTTGKVIERCKELFHLLCDVLGYQLTVQLVLVILTPFDPSWDHSNPPIREPQTLNQTLTAFWSWNHKCDVIRLNRFLVSRRHFHSDWKWSFVCYCQGSEKSACCKVPRWKH